MRVRDLGLAVFDLFHHLSRTWEHYERTGEESFSDRSLLLYGSEGEYTLAFKDLTRAGFAVSLEAAEIRKPRLAVYQRPDEETPLPILENITPQQILFYGNKDAPYHDRDLVGFRPLGKKNLGAELNTAFAHFLRTQSKTGRGSFPNNVPYTLDDLEAGGHYVSVLTGRRPSLLFTHVTLDDIKALRK